MRGTREETETAVTSVCQRDVTRISMSHTHTQTQGAKRQGADTRSQKFAVVNIPEVLTKALFPTPPDPRTTILYSRIFWLQLVTGCHADHRLLSHLLFTLIHLTDDGTLIRLSWLTG